MKSLAAFSLILACFFSQLYASDLFTYQGKLTDAQGASLANGQYRIGVRLWENAAPPAQNPETEVPLWARKYDVPVQGGVFSLMIGATGLPWTHTPEALTSSLKLALSSGNRFLDITVMSDANGTEKPAAQWQTLAPRQSLNAVPYAMNGVPAGTVVPFAGTTAPDGWAFCDGTTTFPINDARYRPLHNTIGTMFNNGTEPEGHFRLPDLRGRTPVGRGKGDTWFVAGQDLSTNWVLGQRFGTEKHLLTKLEMPSHNHGGNTGQAGRHSHTFRTRVDGNNTQAEPERGSGDLNGINATTSEAPDHSHTISPEGADQPHNNMQPIIVLNYIIKL